MSQVTCISLLNYDTLRNKVWAFGMMQFAHSHYQNVDGLQFYKLMGSGRGAGFSIFPDWGTYAVLTVWDSITEAESFIDSSELFSMYRSRSASIKTYYLHNIVSRGKWSGKNPFTAATNIHNKQTDKRIAVITRATIKKRYLFKFWRYVPTSSKPLERSQSRPIFSKGIGEVPIIQMATFSIWKNLDVLNGYAYRSVEHREAIKKTRKLNWYSEELFSRFFILKESEC